MDIGDARKFDEVNTKDGCRFFAINMDWAAGNGLTSNLDDRIRLRLKFSCPYVLQWWFDSGLFKTISFEELVDKTSEGECYICHMDMNETSEDVFSLKCHLEHVYHKSCLELWVKNGHKMECVICH